MSTGERPLSSAAKTLAILLALLAPARMAWIVFTFGENNLSNDYVARVPVVAEILEGRYPFTHIFGDAWIWGGHSWLTILPIYWFEARFFAWDLRVELGIGLLLSALKVLLVWRAATRFVSRRAHFALLPVLSTLAFSVSMVTSFTFGESALQMQLAQVFLAAGCLAFARLEGRPDLRAASLAGCGVLASWSWGGGVMAWPVFTVALFASGERALRRWAWWMAAAALGLSQYVWFLLVKPLPQVVTSPGLHGLWHLPDLLGRPFVNGTGPDFSHRTSALVIGAGGLALAVAVLWCARGELEKRTPALVVLGWSLLLAVQISVLRTDVAPWYIAPMTVFWLGLACLLAAAPRCLALAGFASIAVGLLFSNRTWEDKSFYLPSRAPASAACLREWRTAPAECHDRVFQWGKPGFRPDELAVLGEALERRGLSVFGPSRTYLLQGDVAVGRVSFATSARRAFFSRDGRTPADAGNFRRLDLVLAPGAAVAWRIDLPAQITSARFETRVRVRADDPLLARSARATVEGSASVAHALVARGSAEPLVLDLRQFAGRTVTLRIEAENAPGDAPLVLDAPRVELHGAR